MSLPATLHDALSEIDRLRGQVRDLMRLLEKEPKTSDSGRGAASGPLSTPAAEPLSNAVEAGPISKCRSDVSGELRQMIDTIPDVIFRLDIAANLVSWNRRLEEVTGFTAQELSNRPALSFVPDHEQAKTVDAIRQAFEEGHAELEGHLLTKDQRAIPYYWTGASIKNEKGRVVGITGVGRDVSEKKRIEAEFRRQRQHLLMAQSMAHVGSWDWDIISGDMAWSEEQFRIFGQKPGAIPTNQETFLAALLPDDHDRILSLLNRSITDRIPLDTECRIVRPDGEVRNIHCCGEIICNSAGQPILLVGSTLDITEQKRAEMALQQSEGYFRDLIENSSDIITVLDPVGTISFESPSFERLLGYTQHELDGQIAFDFIHPEDLPNVVEKFQLLIQRPSETQMAEFRFRHKDGSWRCFEGIGRATCDSQGQPCVIANSRDITERKRTDMLLRDSQEKLRQTLRASNTGLWDWNTETNEATLSREWKSQLGYEENELPDSFYTWENQLHPDDHDRAVAYAQAYLARARGEYQQEFRLRHKDGTYRWIEARASFVTEPDGRQVRLLGSHTDITARKQAEEALRLNEERYARATAIGKVGVWELDVTAGTYHGDVNLKSMFGYERDDLSTDPYQWLRLVHPDDQPIAMSYWQKVVDGTIDATHYELRMIRKDGSVIWTDVRGHAQRNPEGKVIRLIGATVDITERKRAQEALVNIVKGFTSSIGSAFFESLSKNLAASLGANYAFIGEVVGKKADRIKTIAMYSDGRTGDNFEYALADTPYENVMRQTTCSYPSHVQERFPNDRLLKDMNVHGYVGTPLFDSTGKAMGLMAVFYNQPIPDGEPAESLLQVFASRAAAELERKRIEEGLRESEERFRRLVDEAPLGITVLDHENRYVKVNQAFCRLVGLSPEELLGQTYARFTHPDDLTANLALATEMFEGSRHGFRLEKRYVRKDGQVIWVVVNATRLTPMEDANHFMVAIIEDITERKRAEEDLRRSHAFIRQIIDTDPNFIFAKDSEGRFMLVNQAVADMRGTTVGSMVGKTDADFIPDQMEVAFFRKQDREVLESGKDMFILEEQITDAQGSTRWLQTIKRPILNDQGQPLMVLGASTDITERKFMEAELRQREQDLRRALDERERISQDLHDGILQSLYAIGLGLEACRPLLVQPPKKAAGQLSVVFDRTIHQLNQVMVEIRNFIAGLESQIIQGGDFPTALRNIVQSMSSSSAMACMVSIDSSAGRTVSTEQALHLINVVREALSNSVRHSRAKRTTVSLKQRARSIRLSINDNGVGFDPTVVHSGGRGLANMTARAKKIGGRLAIRSTPLRGTTIQLDLPKETYHAHP